MNSRCKSIDGNQYFNVFVNNAYFAKFFPMDSTRQFGNASNIFCQYFGVPEKLTFGSYKEQACKGTIFMKEVLRQGIYYHISEPELHKQNSIEGVIKEVRWKW